MILKESEADIVMNLLPGGASKASQWYAEQSMVAGCAFVNVTPNFIASDPAVGEEVRDRRASACG